MILEAMSEAGIFWWSIVVSGLVGSMLGLIASVR